VYLDISILVSSNVCSYFTLEVNHPHCKSLATSFFYVMTLNMALVSRSSINTGRRVKQWKSGIVCWAKKTWWPVQWKKLDKY